MGNQNKLKDLLSTAMVAGTLTLGAQIADVTPDSWKANAMSKKSENKEEKGKENSCAPGKCAPGKCGGNMKKEASKDGSEKKCGAENKNKKKEMAKEKGSDHSCGENTCGA